MHVTNRPSLSDCRVTAESATRHAGHASSGTLATAPTRAPGPNRSNSRATAGRAVGCSARSRSTRLRVDAMTVMEDSASNSERIPDDSLLTVFTPGSFSNRQPRAQHIERIETIRIKTEPRTDRSSERSAGMCACSYLLECASLQAWSSMCQVQLTEGRAIGPFSEHRSAGYRR